MIRQTLPRFADTVVIGGGTSGAVVAARLAEGSDRTVALLEAGPDYGPLAEGHWPEPLLDARSLPAGSHEWGYRSGARYGTPDLALERARVLGGCSSHNGCIAIWGSRADYDGWEALGASGWNTDSLLPFFHEAMRMMRARRPVEVDITPWHRAVLDAAPGVGIPLVDDLNDLDAPIGAAPAPANIVDGMRWNTSFAYLDPVRGRPNLSIHGDLLADRVLIENAAVSAVEVIGPQGPERIETRQVVVCAGTYGSPALLLRSGIGAPEGLRDLGITALHALPGVGRNLHDHPALNLAFSGTPSLVEAMESFAGAHTHYDEQSLIKGRSALCREAFDLHIYPMGGRHVYGGSTWQWVLPVAVMDPRSRGELRLTDRDPGARPFIDHGYLTDPEDRDLAVLLEGLDLVRALASTPPLAGLIGEELVPGPAWRDHAALRQYIRSHSVHYYHAAGTCKMGSAHDPLAVVDARGRVHGLEGLLVADASIMPVVPRANTNIPCVVVGEKIAAHLLGKIE